MRQFSQVTLERHAEFCGTFATEPHEVGWASEAMFFVRLESVSGLDASVRARVQISPDGIAWVDEGTTFPIIGDIGTYFVRVLRFGGWLRLLADIDGIDSKVTVTIHLVIKE